MSESDENQVVKDTIQASSTARSSDITSRILDFLSSASNEQLGACALGLAVVTYFVLGRAGLVLIGAVGGIVLHATWEGNNAKDVASVLAERKRRTEAGVDLVKRLLEWQSIQSRGRITEDLAFAETTKELNFDAFQPETATALNFIVDRVIDDYVRWWYFPLLPVEESFPASCKRILISFLLKFSTHLSRKRPEDVFLNFLTNSTSIFIVFLGELSKALMAQALIDKQPADAIALYLTDYPESSFANVLDRAEQTKKLKAVAEDVLHTFLDPQAYACDPVRTFLMQVLAGLILEPTLVSCSKAEWINGWIVYLLEEGEPEIMNAINAGVGEATSKQAKGIPAAESSPTKQKEVLPTPSGEDEEDRDALEEVKRLNALIASQQFDQQSIKSTATESDTSQHTTSIADASSSAQSTDNLFTPTSSQDDLASLVAVESPSDSREVERVTSNTTGSTQQGQIASTTFDQILPPHNLFSEPAPVAPLTLHKAVVTIFDDAQPGDRATIRSKPNTESLLQIEPASSQHPGWMIARKYADFETLHEVLRRISVISGVPEFNTKFVTVPTWKGQTKNALRSDLEAYLREALSHARLAESEGMKRFLEKDQGLEKMGDKKGALGFPSPEAFQTMGKGMLDVLTMAPKGAAGGGKALLDGMKGVGGVFTGQKRASSQSRQNRGMSTSTLPRMSEDHSSRLESTSDANKTTDDAEVPTGSSQVPMEASRHAVVSRSSIDAKDISKTLGSVSDNASRISFQQEPSLLGEPIPEHDPWGNASEEVLNLPPRPDEIDVEPSRMSNSSEPQSLKAASLHSLEQNEPASLATVSHAAEPVMSETPTASRTAKKKTPFSTEETSVAVELIFAVINELYTLSSAWNIRKTLLNAAKTFLLRPGNPSLEQIRKLLQDSVIEANTSDAGIAYHLLKLRENSLPTEEEFKAWPAPLNDEEKEKLRRKARKLLVEQGMPPALRGIMGAAASGEALGRLFDSLQVEEVSRGLLFAVMLQSLRAVTH